jgi:DNA-binding protein H-NS
MNKNALTELLAQKAALEKQIADVQRDQRAQAIAQVRALMGEYGLTVADLGGAGRPAGPAGKSLSRPASERTPSKVAPKFRDPATGDTWSGRGLKPKWLSAALASGRQLSDFAL